MVKSFRWKLIFSLLISILMIPISAHLYSIGRLKWRLDNYEKLVHSIKAGGIRPKANGEINLSPSLSKLTVNGQVYVLQISNANKEHPKDGLDIFFPIEYKIYEVSWPGEKKAETRVQLAGYLYSDRSLRPGQWFQISDSNSHIDDVCSWDSHPLRRNWYYVEPWYSP